MGHWEDSCSSGFGPHRSGARPGDGHAPDQKLAYVANDGRGSVQKIDLVSNHIVKTIRIAPDAGSHGVAFGAGGKLMFITNTGARTVSVIDTDKDEVVQTVKVATAPEGIAFKPP